MEYLQAHLRPVVLLLHHQVQIQPPLSQIPLVLILHLFKTDYQLNDIFPVEITMKNIEIIGRTGTIPFLENPELVYVRARDIEGVYLSDRELGNPEGFWTRNGREGWSRENILRRASHIQDVRQNTESGMSLDELSQNPVLDDTIRSYYNNPVQVAQVGSYYVFQSDGRHRTLAAQSLDTYIPVLVTGSYTRND